MHIGNQNNFINWTEVVVRDQEYCALTACCLNTAKCPIFLSGMRVTIYILDCILSSLVAIWVQTRFKLLILHMWVGTYLSLVYIKLSGLH